jgi:signal transduction histidine kinase/tetratricopeptide (TPR) repeat protein
MYSSNAQTRVVDSLRKVISNTSSEEEKLNSIVMLHDQPVNADTLLPYILEAEKIVAKTKNSIDEDKVAYCRASYYTRKNHIDSSLIIIDGLIKKYKNDKQQEDKYLGYLFFRSKILDRGNQYSKSISQLVEVIQLAEAQHDTLIQIQAKTGIGWVQIEMEQYKEALEWLYKALHTSADKKFYANYSALYSNIASAYNSLGNADSATYYIAIAIKSARENENLLFLATALSMQAKIFIDHKKSYLAEAPLNEALIIRKKLNDPFYTVYDMSSLATYYASNNQTQKGIALCIEGIQLAKERGLQSQLLMMYKALAENYKAAGKTAEYSHTLEDIIALKDSFNNINSSKQIAELEARNLAQKNEKTIIEQKLNLTVKNYWLFGSAIFAMMAGIIVWLGFKYYNRKQNTKMQLALQEEKRSAAQSIIAAEENERKRIAADLHDNIGAYASAIRADVEKITDNGSEKNSAALSNLQQHSQEIINSLRDTIWVLNKENITITGISDRIKNYISKLRPTYDNIQFHISESISNDVRISSQNALNIFRITQEAVHNALKHSHAANINISISSAANISIDITDDGSGIKNEKSADGNGLLNMKARAKEMGMELSVSSVINAGTTVILKTATTN